MFKKRFTSSFFSILIIFLAIFIFFSPVWFEGKMPIPADTIVGMYHPFRDVVWKGFTAGVPFKNFLITDAVRQQYPWRELAINLLKSGDLPVWNPFTFAGTPLLANIQTALFYPLNILYFFLPFNTVWTIQVISQPLLLATFMFAYLSSIGISKKASSLSSLTLAFSGFSIAWLEWNTTLHTLVWLPLALLSIEKIFKEGSLRWYITLAFSLISIFFAGFLQTSFYAFVLIGLYTIFKMTKSIRRKTESKLMLLKLSVLALLILTITSIQWIPTAKLILSSAREYDQGDVLQREDWFLPWQHLIQFIAPDFFGNPSTLNYWGIFNYMEFIGYIGIIPLTFALIGLFTKQTKYNSPKLFFSAVLVATLILTTPNPISKLPFHLGIPLISSAQPSRQIMLIVFALVFLSALGFEAFFKAIKDKKSETNKNVYLIVTTIIGLALTALWGFVLFSNRFVKDVSAENILVSRRNLIFPTALFASTVIIISSMWVINKFKENRTKGNVAVFLFTLLFLVTAGDLIRFGLKFTPFSDPDFLYPNTRTIEFLKSDKTIWRYMTTDRRILPPNFSITFRLQTIEGYDPIYLKRFGQLISSAQRGEPTLETIPLHRIIRPDNFDSPVYNLLNVKYVLSLIDLENPKLKKVFQEGETRVYQNMEAFPRAFIISSFIQPKSDLEALEQVFSLTKDDIIEAAEIIDYRENEVRIKVQSETGGMLVLADSFYPGWQVFVDQKPAKIERVLYALRGTMIPPGSHEVFYRYSQL